MKIKCIANTGNLLSPAAKALGNSNETKYSVKIGEVFNVYGQHLFKGVLSYLVIGTYENLPSWYPVELFEVVDPMLPLEWYYGFYGYDNLISSIWGYKELVSDENHHDELIEREDKAIRIFLKRKKEIDEYN
ncbi:MAG: hypothetical protein K0S61_4183 [Anaerocolumna sp.]|jgi:hypothetical protein|nr:hypothetical protein [Anaerocolumna sp.]